jgi:hypothetical protein
MQSFIHSKNNPKTAKSTAKEESAASEEARSTGQLSGRFKLNSWSRKQSRRKVVGNVETAPKQDEDQVRL